MAPTVKTAKPAGKASAVKKSTKKGAPSKFTIDVSAPANDNIFDTSAYETFLQNRIKIAGRTNNLGEAITVSRVDAGTIVIIVQPGTSFAKRYVKYLTKKFLKKQQLRDWLRVISTSKTDYQLKYFNVAQDGEEEE